MRGKRTSGYCEHNRRGLLCHGLMGRFRVFTCAEELRGNSPLSAGWYEPCQIICRNAPQGTKYIDLNKMKSTDECLRQEQEEYEKTMEEIRILRANAKNDLILADEMEKKIKEK